MLGGATSSSRMPSGVEGGIGKKTLSSRSTGEEDAQLKDGLNGVDGAMGERASSSQSTGQEDAQPKGDHSPLGLKTCKER